MNSIGIAIGVTVVLILFLWVLLKLIEHFEDIEDEKAMKAAMKILDEWEAKEIARIEAEVKERMGS
ncbi:hypothetical protein vBRpoSV10_195 [Ruegeria phage vB_RpoS-V10]|nr:hypothetical protein vBRpoSV10_195 [Ruegeria phage vB_RpoS-V10]